MRSTQIRGCCWLRQKNVSFECMRIVAFLMVVFNHVFHYLFYGLDLSYEWNVTAVLMAIVKPAVPLFMMMSGALLLRREYSSKELRNKIISVVVTLLLFSLVYFYFDPELKGTDQTFILLFLNGRVSNALWYMYVYLGFLLFLPFIKKMVDSFNEKDYRSFFLVLFLLSMVFPYLLRFLGADISETDFFKFVFSPYLLYFIFGHYFINVKKGTLDLLKNRSYLLPLIYVGSVVLSALMIITSRYNMMDFELWNNKADSFQYGVMSVALFIMLARMRVSSKLIEKGSLFLGSKIYFAYLISDFVIHNLYVPLLQKFNSLSNVLVRFTVISICIAVVCLVFSLIANALVDGCKQLIKSIKDKEQIA